MTKKILFVLTLSLVLAPIASAEINSTSTSAKLQYIREHPEALMERKEDFQEKRAEFKERLQTLKDTRKKTIVERVDAKLAAINKNSTDRMNLSLERMEKLLDKFATRAANLKAEGKDTAGVDSAITEAKTAIKNARDAVTVQAGKEYVADITDETTLKENVGQVMKLLRQDLKTTHDVVKNAKQKVMDVARALAKLKSTEPSVTIEPTTAI